MLVECAIAGLTGALLAFRFRLSELFLVCLALLAAWILIGATGPLGPAAAAGHFAIDLIVLQAGTFATLLVKSRLSLA